MSIILELQEQALESNSDVLSLLRKSFLVSRKLGLKDFQEWVNNELNGYKDINKIPDYRQIKGELKGWNPYNGWISVLMPDDETDKTFTQRKLSDSIPSLNALIGESRLTISIPPDGAAIINRMTGAETKYILQISSNSINNIIEQVKNKILEWAIILEEEGISGDGISFSIEEKSKALNDDKIINYVNNFYQSASDVQFQQGTSNSTQKK